MQIGICLLSSDGFYLQEDGSLPVRPNWDKKLLLDLCEGLLCVASNNTIKTLPNSLKDKIAGLVNESSFHRCMADINLGIGTFSDKPELIFVIRSSINATTGKQLRLSDYDKLIEFTKEDGRFEIWKLKITNN